MWEQHYSRHFLSRVGETNAKYPWQQKKQQLFSVPGGYHRHVSHKGANQKHGQDGSELVFVREEFMWVAQAGGPRAAGRLARLPAGRGGWRCSDQRRARWPRCSSCYRRVVRRLAPSPGPLACAALPCRRWANSTKDPRFNVTSAFMPMNE
jgi:hypothetical protein